MASPGLLSSRLKLAFTGSKGPSFGLWQMFPGTNISRILAGTPGIDWVMVDCEHGNIDDAAMHEAVPAIAARGVSPIVRTPDFQGWMIKREIDDHVKALVQALLTVAKAHSIPELMILVPLIRTVDEVKSVVEAAKFPPLGRRGFGSPLAMERFDPVPGPTQYLQQANASLLTMVQIETKEALEAVEEIAAVPGVDVCFVGPFDLGNNIGRPILNGVMEPELEEAIGNILQATQRHGKKCGIYCTSGAQAKHYADMGFDMISVATDVTALQAVMAETVATARGLEKPDFGGRY